jgi:hypothetical protein
MRNPKELLIASKAFTSETKWLSWWHLLAAIGLYLVTLGISCSSLPLLIRIASSCISGLTIVRLFIIYLQSWCNTPTIVASFHHFEALWDAGPKPVERMESLA